MDPWRSQERQDYDSFLLSVALARSVGSQAVDRQLEFTSEDTRTLPMPYLQAPRKDSRLLCDRPSEPVTLSHGPGNQAGRDGPKFASRELPKNKDGYTHEIIKLERDAPPSATSRHGKVFGDRREYTGSEKIKEETLSTATHGKSRDERRQLRHQPEPSATSRHGKVFGDRREYIGSEKIKEETLSTATHGKSRYTDEKVKLERDAPPSAIPSNGKVSGETRAMTLDGKGSHFSRGWLPDPNLHSYDQGNHDQPDVKYDKYQPLSQGKESYTGEITKKHVDFVENPKQDAPPSAIPGIGKAFEDKLRRAGLDTVDAVIKQYDQHGETWFEKKVGANSLQRQYFNNAMEALHRQDIEPKDQKPTGAGYGGVKSTSNYASSSGPAAVTKKHAGFVSSPPSGDAATTTIPGIKNAHAKKLASAGYTTVSSVQEQYRARGAEGFTDWMKTTTGANSLNQQRAGNAMKDLGGTTLSGTTSSGTKSSGTTPSGTKSSGTKSSGTKSSGTTSSGAKSSGTASSSAKSSGTTSSGAKSSGTTSSGAKSSGTTSSGAKSSGTTSSGAKSSGTTSSGAKSSGTTSSGAKSSGTTSSGAKSSGTTSRGSSGGTKSSGKK